MAREEIETKRLNGDYGVEIEELIDLVEAYRKREFDEDVTMLRTEFGGSEGLAEKLKTSIKDGLKCNDFYERDEEFGDNK